MTSWGPNHGLSGFGINRYCTIITVCSTACTCVFRHTQMGCTHENRWFNPQQHAHITGCFGSTKLSAVEAKWQLIGTFGVESWFKHAETCPLRIAHLYSGTLPSRAAVGTCSDLPQTLLESAHVSSVLGLPICSSSSVVVFLYTFC